MRSEFRAEEGDLKLVATCKNEVTDLSFGSLGPVLLRRGECRVWSAAISTNGRICSRGCVLLSISIYSMFTFSTLRADKPIGDQVRCKENSQLHLEFAHLSFVCCSQVASLIQCWSCVRTLRKVLDGILATSSQASLAQICNGLPTKTNDGVSVSIFQLLQSKCNSHISQVGGITRPLSDVRPRDICQRMRMCPKTGGSARDE